MKKIFKINKSVEGILIFYFQLFLSIFVFNTILAAIVLMTMYNDYYQRLITNNLDYSELPPSFLILSSFFTFISFILVTMLTNSKSLSLKNMKESCSKKGILVGIKYGLILVLIGRIMDIILNLTIINSSSDIPQNTQALANMGPFMGIIVAAILAPIGEEIFFRQNLRFLIDNDRHYLFATTIFFGLAHMQNFDNPILLFYSILWTGFTGFIMGKIYLKTKWIGTSIIAHSIYNFITMLVFLFIP